LKSIIRFLFMKFFKKELLEVKTYVYRHRERAREDGLSLIQQCGSNGKVGGALDTLEKLRLLA